MSDENKRRLKEYKKKYREAKRSGEFSIILLDFKYENVQLIKI